MKNVPTQPSLLTSGLQFVGESIRECQVSNKKFSIKTIIKKHKTVWLLSLIAHHTHNSTTTITTTNSEWKMWSEECPQMTSLHTSHLQFLGDMSRECQVSTINLVWKQKIAMHCVASLSYVAHHIHYSSRSSWLFPQALCQNSSFQVYLRVTLLAVSFFFWPALYCSLPSVFICGE